MNQKCLVSLQNITKKYSGVTVLHDVSMDIKQGEVHGLVGANGAGKSTLIKVISGAINSDSGKIVFDGMEYRSMTPQLSDSLGIEVIYQEFNLVTSLSVAENIFLGKRHSDSRFVNFKILEKKADDILKAFGLPINVKEPVKGLSVAYKQIVEIAKALSHEIKLLILDEPTAPLSDNEVKVLFKLIKSLKQQGISVIYISHRLEEVFEVCDRITVLRDGEKIITLNTDETNRKELISYMINSNIGEEYPERKGKQSEEVLLEVKNLYGKGFKDISFKVHKGEILGITGLVGAKRTEIVRGIFGADRLDKGDIIYCGEPLKAKSPYEAISKGIALIPEDRKTQGVVLELPIKWNLTMSVLSKLLKFGVIQKEKENEIVSKYKDTLKIKMNSENQKISSLSGGNQQKVVLSKWLANNPQLIIFDEPTRGIDVGAKKEIYKLINQLADEGLGVILISSEMDEMIGLSDRMIVLSEGKITGHLEKKEFDKQMILDYESGTL